MSIIFKYPPAYTEVTDPAGTDRVLVWITADGEYKWISINNLQSEVVAGALLRSGGTMTGNLTTATPGATLHAFTIPHGVAPTSPTNGDMWTTTAGLYVRINGVTVGPLAASPDLSSYVTDAELAAALSPLEGATTWKGQWVPDTDYVEFNEVVNAGRAFVRSDVPLPEISAVSAVGRDLSSYPLYIRGQGSAGSIQYGAFDSFLKAQANESADALADGLCSAGTQALEEANNSGLISIAFSLTDFAALAASEKPFYILLSGGTPTTTVHDDTDELFSNPVLTGGTGERVFIRALDAGDGAFDIVGYPTSGDRDADTNRIMEGDDTYANTPTGLTLNAVNDSGLSLTIDVAEVADFDDYDFSVDVVTAGAEGECISEPGADGDQGPFWTGIPARKVQYVTEGLQVEDNTDVVIWLGTGPDNITIGTEFESKYLQVIDLNGTINSAHPLTITPYSGTINGESNFTIDAPYAIATFSISGGGNEPLQVNAECSRVMLRNRGTWASDAVYVQNDHVTNAHGGFISKGYNPVFSDATFTGPDAGGDLWYVRKGGYTYAYTTEALAIADDPGTASMTQTDDSGSLLTFEAVNGSGTSGTIGYTGDFPAGSIPYIVKLANGAAEFVNSSTETGPMEPGRTLGYQNFWQQESELVCPLWYAGQTVDQYAIQKFNGVYYWASSDDVESIPGDTGWAGPFDKYSEALEDMLTARFADYVQSVTSTNTAAPVDNADPQNPVIYNPL